MEDEEVEFSFKDLAVYCLKKWFIVLIAAVVGICAGLVTTLFKSEKTEAYRVAAEFCSFEIYLKNNPDISDREYAPTSYNNTATDVMRGMSSASCIAQFINSPEFTESAAKAFPDAKISTDKERQALFNSAFEVVAGGTGLNVGISGNFDTDEKRAAAKGLVKGYAVFARDTVYAANNKLSSYTDDVNAVVGAVSVSDPFYYIATDADAAKSGGLAKNILIGFVIGLVVGIIAVIIVYCADPRIKSMEALSRAGEVVAKTKGDELDASAVSRIAGKTKSDKMLLIASPENNAFAEVLSKAVANEFASSGLKTLYVDFSVSGEGGDASDFFAGKKISETVETDGAIDVMGCKNRRDVLSLIAKKDKFLSLKNEYDKIVVAYSDYTDGGAIALGDMADGVLYVINQKVTRIKAFEALAADTCGTDKTVGLYVHNSI